MKDNHTIMLSTDQGPGLLRSPSADVPYRSLSERGRDLRNPKWRSTAPAEETLIDDDRSKLTPAQAVESRLMSRLQGASLPVSHLQMRGLVRSRRDD
jgi:hypothetical protein